MLGQPTESRAPTSEQCADQQLDAYRRERAGALKRLDALRSLDPQTQFVVPSELPVALGPQLMLGPTAADLVAQAETAAQLLVGMADVEAGALANIDGEIGRLEGEAS